jgi:O-antigen/teichoic acid export membrane protein
LALGNIRRFTFLLFSSSVMLVVLVATLSPIAGAVGAAVAYLITAGAFFPLFYWITMRVLDLNLRSVVGVFIRPVISSATMYFAVRYAARFLEPSSIAGECAMMFAIVLIGGLTYCAVLLGCWRVAGLPAGPEKLIMTTVRDVLHGVLDWMNTSASSVDRTKGNALESKLYD